MSLNESKLPDLGKGDKRRLRKFIRRFGLLDGAVKLQIKADLLERWLKNNKPQRVAVDHWRAIYALDWDEFESAIISKPANCTLQEPPLLLLLVLKYSRGRDFYFVAEEKGEITKDYSRAARFTAAEAAELDLDGVIWLPPRTLPEFEKIYLP